MKHLVLLVLTIGWVLIINAQPQPNRPDWITRIPKPSEKNKTIYYRVTIGEGVDYNKAYANAFAKAILESSWKLGLKVSNENDINTIERSVYNDIVIEPNEMNLPMNKVCEYQENLQTTTGYRLYILWQIATAGNIIPVFEDYDCH